MSAQERKAELLAEYPKGYVTDPGKFEGENIRTIYFYELMLDGCYDETLEDTDGTAIDVFKIDANDRKIWDLPSCVTRVGVWSNDSGFVFLSKWTDEAYESAVAELEGSRCEEDEEEMES